MTVYIMVGTSGSGKSTFAKRYGAVVVSADQYFMDEGEYNFDPSKLGEAHGQCLLTFVSYLEGTYDGVWPGDNTNTTLAVVDNTNTTLMEIAPYMALAMAYGHEVVPVVFSGRPSVCAERNVHGVPVAVVRRQAANIKATLDAWPRHWPRWVPVEEL